MQAFYNLKILISLILFLFLCQSTAYSSTINDSLYLRIYPNEIIGDSIPEKIYGTITNNTTSAYLTPFDLFIQPIGLESIFSYVWPLYSSYSANLLFLFKDHTQYQFGSGFSPVFYCMFPKLFLIPPYSERTFVINLKKYDYIYIKNKWILSGRIALANKDSLERIINKFYPDRYSEYIDSISSNDLIPINTTDSLKSLSNCNDNIEPFKDEILPADNLEKIKDAFKTILWSY